MSKWLSINGSTYPQLEAGTDPVPSERCINGCCSCHWHLGHQAPYRSCYMWCLPTLTDPGFGRIGLVGAGIAAPPNLCW